MATDIAFDVEAVRRDFPILGKPLPKDRVLVYLDNASSAQKPRAVIDCEREVYESCYANAYRGVYRFGAQISIQIDEVREKLARFVGAASADEIVFTSGTTMAINLVAQSWGRRLSPGDEIVVNEMEHHANLVPWQMLAKSSGASLRFIPLTDDGRLDVARVDEAVTSQAKIVAVTAMSNVLGTINPIAEIAEIAHDRGAVVLVDGAQSVPHLPTDVQNPVIDFLTFSSHKMFGPTGVGVLYGRRELLESMEPVFGGGHMIEQVHRESSTWAEVPAKFEAGTPPIAQLVALGAAVDYLNGFDFEAVAAHEHTLLAAAYDKLSAIPGVTIYGPEKSPDPFSGRLSGRGPILSFTVDGVHPEDLAHLLDRRGVFVRHGHHCTMPLHERLGVTATTRASFAMYNTLAEVDALAEGIEYARQRMRVA